MTHRGDHLRELSARVDDSGVVLAVVSSRLGLNGERALVIYIMIACVKK